MNNGGWVKLHRELIKKSIWQLSTPEQKVILITILLLANHEETKWEWQGKQFICKPGQFITSLSSLAKEAGPGVTMRNVRTALERFEKLEFLTNRSSKTGRLITVVNWAKYQGDARQTDKQTDKDLTKTRQRPDKQPTTNKNIKNDKEVKKGRSIYYGTNNDAFSPPTIEEVKLYCSERNNMIDAEHFHDYYSARGWELANGRKMKDWRAAVRTWERNERNRKSEEKRSTYIDAINNRLNVVDEWLEEENGKTGIFDFSQGNEGRLD